MSTKIDITKCTGCGACAGVCPQNAIRVRNNLAVVNEDLCVDCGRCFPVCPSGAISAASPAPVAAVKSVETYGYQRIPVFRGGSLTRSYFGRARGGMPRRGGWANTAYRVAVYPPSPSSGRGKKMEALKEQYRQIRGQLAEIEARIQRLSNQ